MNDPTTAVQALDAMDGLLRALATRELDIGRITGSDGTLRITLVLPTCEDHLAVALDEIIALREISPNVSRRILRLLDDLEAITPRTRHPALAAHRRKIQNPNAQSPVDHSARRPNISRPRRRAQRKRSAG